MDTQNDTNQEASQQAETDNVKDLDGSQGSPSAPRSQNIKRSLTLLSFREWGRKHDVSHEMARLLVEAGKVPVVEVRVQERASRYMIEEGTPYPENTPLQGEVNGMIPLSIWAKIIAPSLGVPVDLVLNRIRTHIVNGNARFVIKMDGAWMVHKTMPWPYRRMKRDLLSGERSSAERSEAAPTSQSPSHPQPPRED